MDIWNIEFAENTKVLLDAWNMKTNVWLRECVYKRVTPKGKKPGFRSSLATFMTSAFWVCPPSFFSSPALEANAKLDPQHGIAPGYYLTFFFFAFVQTTARLARAYLRPLLLPANHVSKRGAPPPPQTRKKQLYDVLSVLATVTLTNYGTLPFMLLTVDDSFVAWNSVAWYGHFLIAGALAFFYLGGNVLLTQVQAVRVKQAGYQMERDEINRTVKSLPGTPVKAATLPPLDEAARTLEKRLAGRANGQAQ